MKATGIIRRIDDLGRLVIPREFLKEKQLIGAMIEFFIDGDSVILKEYNPGCIFCGDMKDIIEHKGKRICKNCAKDIANEGK